MMISILYTSCVLHEEKRSRLWDDESILRWLDALTISFFIFIFFLGRVLWGLTLGHCEWRRFYNGCWCSSHINSAQRWRRKSITFVWLIFSHLYSTLCVSLSLYIDNSFIKKNGIRNSLYTHQLTRNDVVFQSIKHVEEELVAVTYWFWDAMDSMDILIIFWVWFLNFIYGQYWTNQKDNNIGYIENRERKLYNFRVRSTAPMQRKDAHAPTV